MPPRHGPTSNMLSAVRGLVPLSSKRSPSSKTFTSTNTTPHPYEENTSSPLPPPPRRPRRNPAKQALWRRHRTVPSMVDYLTVPSMVDYLTLAQLENIWYRQDSYFGGIEVPQAIVYPSNYDDAVELPLIAKHQLRRGSVGSSRSDLTHSSPHSRRSSQDDSAVIDGVMHPALRATPYLI